MINKGYLTAKTDKESDEMYTPEEAVFPIIDCLDRYMESIEKDNLTIWCPFDTEKSAFVEVLSKAGYEVIYSHINNGQDFFEYEPEEDYDIIISNPPFSLKDQVLHRLKMLNKPFAMLLPLPSLQGQKRFDDLVDCQAIIFDKRINFYSDLERTTLKKGVAFATIYICRNFLEKDLLFLRL